LTYENFIAIGSKCHSSKVKRPLSASLALVLGGVLALSEKVVVVKDGVALLLIVPEEDETFHASEGKNRSLRVHSYGFNCRF